MLEEDETKGGKDKWWELCSTCWNDTTQLQIQRDSNIAEEMFGE